MFSKRQINRILSFIPEFIVILITFLRNLTFYSLDALILSYSIVLILCKIIDIMAEYDNKTCIKIIKKYSVCSLMCLWDVIIFIVGKFI